MSISTPKGTRDFDPIQMARRNYIFSTIKDVFACYGFQQIETPAMENLSTLLGKYGEEGDKLLFKILNSGNFLDGISTDKLSSGDSQKLATDIAEKGLRYDLTVPFARYVVQHRNDIAFPFKRYQIQPVWRADRPQKGRYREFYQCDADVIGSTSLLNEVELLQIIDQVFTTFDINVTMKLNNRKILFGIAEVIGQADKITDITVAIDKLDKIGLDLVNTELRNKGIDDAAINKLQPVILMSGSNTDKLNTLRTLLQSSTTGMKGIEEIDTILNYLKTLAIKQQVELDITLARGLNYYTGAIIEVKANDVEIGSISGGGRYDDLTGIFGMPNVSGVGISFGADRIYDVLLQLNKFRENNMVSTQLLFINFGSKEEAYCLPIVKQLRAQQIHTELYPEAAKLKKQMAYADAKKIPYVALVGENEMNANNITIKNMQSGVQQQMTIEEIGTLMKP